MENRVARAMDRLTSDPWRESHPFSPDLRDALERVLDDGVSEADRLSALNAWLGRHQPCLFGKIAAKHGAIAYCLLMDKQLRGSDESLHDAIQDARLKWLRRGFEGTSSAFVIVAASRTLAVAEPSDSVKEIALRLASLYLERDVRPDRIEHDRLFLEKPGTTPTVWEWHVGANYFSAQGDGRWWQDHRIPAGIAFSMNSVGHMVKSDQLSHGLEELNLALGLGGDERLHQPIKSLGTALEFAMRTIHGATRGVSGPATYLVDARTGASDTRPRCPIELRKPLLGKDHCEYRGWYHTDYTIPSEYFRPDDRRPNGVNQHTLDFTYLFDDRLDNPEFGLMGEGRRIRGEGPPDTGMQKRRLGVPSEVSIDDLPLLKRALNRDGGH